MWTILLVSTALATTLANLGAWRLGLAFPSSLHLIADAAVVVAAWRHGSAGRLALVVIGAALLILFGTPLSITAGDARFIWFFHAKRIYLDNTLFAQLDSYATHTHNDYPVLVPSIAASIARTVGYWNEVLPRLSILPIIVPTLCFITMRIGRVNHAMLWLVGLLVLANKLLLNGYMDALLALVLATTGVAYAELSNPERVSRQGERRALEFLVVVSTAVLPHLKNEGMLAVAALAVAMVPRSRTWQLPTVATGVATLGFVWGWRLPVLEAGIGTDLFVPGVSQRVLARLADPSGLAMIVAWFMVWAVPPLAVAVAHARSRRHAGLDARLQERVVVFAAIYVAGMVAVYVLTPNDLWWHLETSVRRVMLPVAVFVMTVALSSIAWRPRDPVEGDPLRLQTGTERLLRP